jgi:tRNA pseudouridine38-40 synthase
MSDDYFRPSNPEYPIRIAMGVEFEGQNYKGWQIQKNGLTTVQGELTKAISQVANHPVHIVCAGRTDTGVHAAHQVFHFDTNATRKPFGWSVGPNGLMDKDIRIQWAKDVGHSFHARFSAQSRRYRYVIYNNAMQPGNMPDGMTWERKPLDEELMHQAAQILVGKHDFSSYRAVGCQAASPVRTIEHLTVRRYGKMIVLDAKADGFLYHMIRNIAGVLIEIGAGQAPVQWAQQVLDYKDRNQGGVTAKPHGLYFVDAMYDDKFELPKPDLGPHFLSWIKD